jgi:hypothetical protein
MNAAIPMGMIGESDCGCGHPFDEHVWVGGQWPHGGFVCACGECYLNAGCEFVEASELAAIVALADEQPGPDAMEWTMADEQETNN